MKLTIGFSPCPNDTFIFDALVNGKIGTKGLVFEPVLEDVETLNQWALDGKLDITKLSFPAFFQATDKYKLLHAGSALGKGVGPLLISKKKMGVQSPGDLRERIEAGKIALPGQHTTAHLLFSYAFPSAKRKDFMIFSRIEDAVLMEAADYGVIIHENRFTYQDKGLNNVLDLGEYWEQQTGLPIPLGGIAINRHIEDKIAFAAEGLIRESLGYAYKEYPIVSSYVKEHSQTMSEDVMRKHIDLYVNDFSTDLGATGKKAIDKLYELFLSGHPGNHHLLSSQLFLS